MAYPTVYSDTSEGVAKVLNHYGVVDVYNKIRHKLFQHLIWIITSKVCVPSSLVASKPPVSELSMESVLSSQRPLHTATGGSPLRSQATGADNKPKKGDHVQVTAGPHKGKHGIFTAERVADSSPTGTYWMRQDYGTIRQELPVELKDMKVVRSS